MFSQWFISGESPEPKSNRSFIMSAIFNRLNVNYFLDLDLDLNLSLNFLNWSFFASQHLSSASLLTGTLRN